MDSRQINTLQVAIGHGVIAIESLTETHHLLEIHRFLTGQSALLMDFVEFGFILSREKGRKRTDLKIDVLILLQNVNVLK